MITREKDTKTNEIRDNLKHAYATGHGRVVIRARATVEEPRPAASRSWSPSCPTRSTRPPSRSASPSWSARRSSTASPTCATSRDRQGMRLVVELKREANPRTVLNQLYKHTALQQAYSFNVLALVDGEPRVLTLKRMLQHFLDYRQDVLTRRTQYELDKARARAHILEGFKIALDNLDAVIRTIRESESAEVAAPGAPMDRFRLTEIQARAILDMQLRRLAALERQQILDELKRSSRTSPTSRTCWPTRSRSSTWSATSWPT